jgi:NAD(P)-dependent dehydrogenase (short-subunit alcohol dehydrogenase family)
MTTTLITGANRGLGLEFARAAAERGDRVIATVREPGKAPAEVKKLAAEVHTLDVSDPAALEGFATKLKATPIDILVNNAGVMGQDPKAGTLSFAEFQRVFNTNVFGACVLAQMLLPALRLGEKKQIFNISSMLGSIKSATPGFSSAYNMSKAALNMFSARLAKDLAKEGFTVVSFCPGWNKTDMGGPNAPLDPAQSVRKLLATGQTFTTKDSGTFRTIDGGSIPF